MSACPRSNRRPPGATSERYPPTTSSICVHSRRFRFSITLTSSTSPVRRLTASRAHIRGDIPAFLENTPPGRGRRGIRMNRVIKCSYCAVRGRRARTGSEARGAAAHDVVTSTTPPLASVARNRARGAPRTSRADRSTARLGNLSRRRRCL